MDELREVFERGLTSEDYQTLADLAPLDAWQRMLLAHLRCLRGLPGAVEFEPQANGGILATCRHCQGHAHLVPLRSDDWGLWWMVLVGAIIVQAFDSFISHGGRQTQADAIWGVVEDMRLALGRVVLITNPGPSELTH